MSKANYIPINRKFFDHPFWLKKREYSEAEAWLYLLKEARFEVSEGSKLIGGKVIKWNRGELPASLRFLGLEWSWDKNKVGRFLKLLISEKMIVIRTANGTDQSIITLCNYDSYNSRSEKPGQQTGQGRDSPGTPTGQGRDNTNTGNKGNTDKNTTQHTAQAPEIFSDDRLPPIAINPQRPDFAPSWEDVYKYFDANGHPAKARKFFENYEGNLWRDKFGKPVTFFPSKANAWISSDLQAEAKQAATKPKTTDKKEANHVPIADAEAIAKKYR